MVDRDKPAFLQKLFTLHAYISSVRHVILKIIQKTYCRSCESVWMTTGRVVRGRLISGELNLMQEHIFDDAMKIIANAGLQSRHLTVPESESYVAKVVWGVAWSYDEAMRSLILFWDGKDFSTLHVMQDTLMKVNFTDVLEPTRLFYLWSLHEMIRDDWSLQSLKPEFALLVAKYGDVKTFADTPLDIVDALHPITGHIGRIGGQFALNSMIGQYAARPATRAEVIARLMARA